MANLNVNPEYDIDMEQLTPETRAHADRFNERYGQLLGNDAFLKGKLEEANTSIERAMAVAQGKSAGLVFNTYAELIAYIAVPANAEKFRLGDQFLIKAMDVPDYWWDNTVTTEQTDIEGNVISAKNSSGKVIGALVELEARKVDLSKYDENDAALFDNMSDQYSASRTYDVGDICIYDNNLYKCVTAVETAETFDQAKWNKTSFAALHADQEKKISENTQSLSQLGSVYTCTLTGAYAPQKTMCFGSMEIPAGTYFVCGSAKHSKKGGICTISIGTDIHSSSNNNGTTIYGNVDYDGNKGCVCDIINLTKNTIIYFQVWAESNFEIVPMSFTALRIK